MMKTLNKLGIQGNFLNLIKGNYEKPTVSITLSGERLEVLHLRSEIRQEYPLSPLLFDTEVLAGVIRQEKDIKGRKK